MLEKSQIRFLRHRDHRLAYEVRGDGPPLVAPAWWVSHLELDWESAGFRRFWEGVADTYTLIRYDRLGVGMSDRTVRDADLTLDAEVAMLRALLDELELERVSLLGGSCGSCTAIAFAAKPRCFLIVTICDICKTCEPSASLMTRSPRDTAALPALTTTTSAPVRRAWRSSSPYRH